MDQFGLTRRSACIRSRFYPYKDTQPVRPLAVERLQTSPLLKEIENQSQHVQTPPRNTESPRYGCRLLSPHQQESALPQRNRSRLPSERAETLPEGVAPGSPSTHRSRHLDCSTSSGTPPLCKHAHSATRRRQTRPRAPDGRQQQIPRGVLLEES